MAEQDPPRLTDPRWWLRLVSTATPPYYEVSLDGCVWMRLPDPDAGPRPPGTYVLRWADVES